MASNHDTTAPPSTPGPAPAAPVANIDKISKEIEDAKSGYDAKSKVAVKDIVDLMPVIHEPCEHVVDGGVVIVARENFVTFVILC